MSTPTHPPGHATPATAEPAPVVLVTGASRGLGIEFVRQYAADGWSVIACCRHPASATELATLAQRYGSIQIEALDITNHGQVDALAAKLAGTAVDLLLNNAGIMGALPFAENLQRQHLGSLDYTLWEQVFRTNTLGTVKMTEAFLDLVAASRQKKIVSLSSTTGSISESQRPAFAYTSSKTALNKAMTLIAEQLRPRQVIVTLVCPGYVQTRMNVGGATLEAGESVRALRTLVAKLTLEDSGRFLRYDGQTIGW